MEDPTSEYNKKYRTKLLRKKLSRVKKQTYKGLSNDSKVLEELYRKKQSLIDLKKKKKYGELMKHIQDQNE